jgi:transcriptional regulator with XRE-family HTH domain
MHRLKALGPAIREVRKSRGLSQEKLAELSKLHRNFIGLVERNATVPALDSLIAIADALEIKLSELICRMEQGSEDQ